MVLTYWCCQRPWCSFVASSGVENCADCIDREDDGAYQGIFDHITPCRPRCHKRGPVFTAAHKNKCITIDKETAIVEDGYQHDIETYQLNKDWTTLWTRHDVCKDLESIRGILVHVDKDKILVKTEGDSIELAHPHLKVINFNDCPTPRPTMPPPEGLPRPVQGVVPPPWHFLTHYTILNSHKPIGSRAAKRPRADAATSMEQATVRTHRTMVDATTSTRDETTSTRGETLACKIERIRASLELPDGLSMAEVLAEAHVQLGTPSESAVTGFPSQARALLAVLGFE